jgi:CelD/BcsL family acetyltransferase involved in cellulose biosynthesis
LSQALSVRQFKGKDGYAEICDDWSELMGSVTDQYFYHHPAWFYAYFERPDYDDDIYFRCVFEGPRLIAVCPLVFHSRYGNILREGALPNQDILYMPDIAVADSVDLSAVWKELSAPGGHEEIGSWDYFNARSVLETSAIARSLRATVRDIVSESTVSRCAIVDIVDYDEAIRGLRKKFRGNLNNAKNRLGAQKSVEFRRVTEPREIESAYDDYVALEQSGWKGDPDNKREGYPAPAAIGLRESKYLFYKSALREFSKSNSVEINLLNVNDTTVGAQIFVVLRDRSFLLKTAFSEDSKEFSPGHVLLDFAYKHYAESGAVKQMCFITDYDWFKYWNPRYVSYLNIKAFKKTLRGRLASVAYSVRRNKQ